MEELNRKGLITLGYDAIGQEYYVQDFLNHNMYWFKSYIDANNKFNDITRIK